MPTTRGTTQYGPGCLTAQPVSHHGITPATTPGATTKNTRLPAAAFTLRTTPFCPPSATPDESCGGEGYDEPVGIAVRKAAWHHQRLVRHTALNPERRNSCENNSDSGGGTRTPDTRIMIPLL
jgi:hypothetical protein